MKNSANYIELHGMQYHIGCKAGDVADKVLLVGDPARAKKIAAHFVSLQVQKSHREFLTFTGIYEDQRLTVMSTGMGEGNMEIAFVEISHLVPHPIIIRCGSCSALQKETPLGSLIISDKAIDLGNVCSYYDIALDDIHASAMVRDALKAACEKMNYPYKIGTTATAPGFYGPQARKIEGFPIRKPNMIEELQHGGVENLEMEIATLFGLANLRKTPAGAICAVYGNRATDSFLSEEQIYLAEQNCINASLLALTQIVV